jgi:hypothetical protein
MGVTPTGMQCAASALSIRQSPRAAYQSTPTFRLTGGTGSLARTSTTPGESIDERY